MARRPSTERPPTAADELAAKLQAITEAAPGLWRAGVLKVTDGPISFDLQEPPPIPVKKSDEDEAADADPLSLAAYRRGMKP